MFSGAALFNGNISTWDITKVQNTRRMFYSATSFNTDISSWETTKVTTMKVSFIEFVN